MLRTLVPGLIVFAGALLIGCSAGSPTASPGDHGGSSGGGASGGSTTGGSNTGGGGGAPSSAAGGAGASGSSAGAGVGGAAAGVGGATGGEGGATGGEGAASGAGGGSAGSGATGCSSLPFCDDFEGVPAGSPPDSTKWIATVLSDCTSTAPTKPTVDDSQHHSGTRSLKITGAAGYCDYAMVGNATAFAAIGNVVYGRYYVRFETALGDGHVAFMTFGDTSQGGKALRMGGQKKALQWNRQSDDATLPAQSPTGIGLSIVPPVATWMCLEFMIDQAQGLISTWVDGTLVTGLVADGTSTPDVDDQWGTTYKPVLTNFNIGWQNYGDGPKNLWFDDVALSSTRIGCN